MNCANCSIETANPKFCSRSCSASYTNRVSPKRSKSNTCQECCQEIPSNRVYCPGCYDSLWERKNQKFISDWLCGVERGGTDASLSKVARRYLIEQSGEQCTRCSWNERHPDTGEVPLEINHIDGDGTNHSPSNLEVICPNCHSLTSSYRGRNAGSGRPVYYLRVQR